MTIEFALHTERRDGVTVAALEGEIDMANATMLQARLLRDVTNDVKVLVLDLTDTAYIDSSGVRVLFGLSTLLREHGQEIYIVVGEGSQPERTLELSGIDHAANVFGVLTDAVSAAEARS